MVPNGTWACVSILAGGQLGGAGRVRRLQELEASGLTDLAEEAQLALRVLLEC